jgi:hypothetical protein
MIATVGYITKLGEKKKKTLDRLSSENRTSTQLEFIPTFFWTNFHSPFCEKKKDQQHQQIIF